MDWTIRLKEIMRERGVNQRDLAEMLGISPGAVSQYMQRNVKVSTLEKICYVLGVELSDLFGEPKKVVEYDEEYREAHVHGYIRIGKRIVEVNSIQELKDAVTACEVNYLN